MFVTSYPRRPDILQAPYFPASRSPYPLPSSVSRKSCSCHSYELPGVGVFFPFRKVCWLRRRELAFHSSSFFSHPCALFCTAKNSTRFFSIDSALFAQNHPGWGYASLPKPVTSAILEGQKWSL